MAINLVPLSFVVRESSPITIEVKSGKEYDFTCSYSLMAFNFVLKEDWNE